MFAHVENLNGALHCTYQTIWYEVLFQFVHRSRFRFMAFKQCNIVFSGYNFCFEFDFLKVRVSHIAVMLSHVACLSVHMFILSDERPLLFKPLFSSSHCIACSCLWEHFQCCACQFTCTRKSLQTDALCTPVKIPVIVLHFSQVM